MCGEFVGDPVLQNSLQPVVDPNTGELLTKIGPTAVRRDGFAHLNDSFILFSGNTFSCVVTVSSQVGNIFFARHFSQRNGFLLAFSYNVFNSVSSHSMSSIFFWTSIPVQGPWWATPVALRVATAAIADTMNSVGSAVQSAAAMAGTFVGSLLPTVAKGATLLFHDNVHRLGMTLEALREGGSDWNATQTGVSYVTGKTYAYTMQSTTLSVVEGSMFGFLREDVLGCAGPSGEGSIFYRNKAIVSIQQDSTLLFQSNQWKLMTVTVGVALWSTASSPTSLDASSTYLLDNITATVSFRLGTGNALYFFYLNAGSGFTVTNGSSLSMSRCRILVAAPLNTSGGASWVKGLVVEGSPLVFANKSSFFFDRMTWIINAGLIRPAYWFHLSTSSALILLNNSDFTIVNSSHTIQHGADAAITADCTFILSAGSSYWFVAGDSRVVFKDSDFFANGTNGYLFYWQGSSSSFVLLSGSRFLSVRNSIVGIFVGNEVLLIYFSGAAQLIIAGTMVPEVTNVLDAGNSYLKDLVTAELSNSNWQSAGGAYPFPALSSAFVVSRTFTKFAAKSSCHFLFLESGAALVVTHQSLFSVQQSTISFTGISGYASVIQSLNSAVLVSLGSVLEFRDGEITMVASTGSAQLFTVRNNSVGVTLLRVTCPFFSFAFLTLENLGTLRFQRNNFTGQQGANPIGVLPDCGNKWGSWLGAGQAPVNLSIPDLAPAITGIGNNVFGGAILQCNAFGVTYPSNLQLPPTVVTVNETTIGLPCPSAVGSPLVAPAFQTSSCGSASSGALYCRAQAGATAAIDIPNNTSSSNSNANSRGDGLLPLFPCQCICNVSALVNYNPFTAQWQPEVDPARLRNLSDTGCWPLLPDINADLAPVFDTNQFLRSWTTTAAPPTTTLSPPTPVPTVAPPNTTAAPPNTTTAPNATLNSTAIPPTHGNTTQAPSSLLTTTAPNSTTTAPITTASPVLTTGNPPPPENTTSAPNSTHDPVRRRSVTLSVTHLGKELRPRQVVPPPLPGLQGSSSSAVSLVVDSKAAATAIVATGTTSAAVSAIASPAAAGNAVRLGSVASIVACSFSDSDDELQPGYLEAPLQMRVGSSRFALYVGSQILQVLAFIVGPGLLLVVCWFIGRRPPFPKSKPFLLLTEKVIGSAFYMFLSYFGPGTWKVLILVALHDGATAGDIAVASACTAVFTGITAWIAFLVIARAPHRFNLEFQPPSNESRPVTSSPTGDVFADEELKPLDREHVPIRVDARRSDSNGALGADFRLSNSTPHSMFRETIGQTVEAGKSTLLSSLPIRMYFFEELLITILLQILDGVRPQNGSCERVAVGMAITCLLHCLYLVAVRPYHSTLEWVLVFLGALVLLAMAVLAVVISFQDLGGSEGTSSSSSSVLLKVFGYLAAFDNIYIFVQATVLALQAYTVSQKRRINAHWSNRGEGSATKWSESVGGHEDPHPCGDPQLLRPFESPLLQAPPNLDDARCDAQFNPLHVAAQPGRLRP